MCATTDFSQGFDDCAHVADRHRLLQQILQRTGHHTQGQLTRHQFLDQLGRFRSQLVQQFLRFVVTHQFRGVVAQNLVHVGRDGCARIHHGITQSAGLVTPGGLDPDSFQTKSGLFGGLTFDFAVDLARVDRQFATHLDFAATTHHAVQNDVISVGLQIERIADAHRLHQKAQFRRELFAHAFDTRHQLAARLDVDQGNQAIADFKADQVHLLHIVPVQFLGAFIGWQSRRGQTLLQLHLFAHDHEAHPSRGGGQRQENQVRHTWHQTHDGQNAGRNEQSRHIRELAACLLGHRLGSRHPGHDNGGSQRQKQRRNLSNQAITDGQQDIQLGRLAHGQVVLANANGQAADDVDDQNQQTRNRIATHEFGGTVHGAKEVRFLR